MSGIEIFGLAAFATVFLGLVAIPATAAYAFWKLEHKHPVVK
jgi:hypothetical protein